MSTSSNSDPLGRYLSCLVLSKPGSQCCIYTLTEPPAPKIHVHTPSTANAFWGHHIEDWLGLGLGNRISFGVGGGGHLAVLILVIKIILAIILRSGYYSGCRNPNNLFGG